MRSSWIKLPSLLSSTICSSDREYWEQESYRQIQLHDQRAEQARYARDARSYNLESAIKTALGAAPLTQPLPELVSVVKARLIDPPSDETIRKYIKIISDF